MNNSASVINSLEWDGRTLPVMVSMKPPPGSTILCQWCDTTALKVVGDTIVVVGRHHGSWHTTVLDLKSLGFVRIA